MQERVNPFRWIAGVAGKLWDPYRDRERRQNARLKSEFDAVLSGGVITTAVKGVDAGKQGIGVVSADAIEPGTLVFVRLTSLGRMGFAHVRHCVQQGSGYFIGLEFRDKLVADEPDQISYDSRRGQPKGDW